MRTVLRGIATALVLAIVHWGAGVARAQEVAPGLKIGDELNKTNANLAKDLLPPEILKHYQNGDYRNRIIAFPSVAGRWEKSFLAATEKNATTLDVDDRGTIIDRATGKQPVYVYGLPFPNIQADDPKAAVKIVWNQFYGYWAGGNTYNRTLVAMLNRKGVEREIVADGWFKFFDGEAPKYREENALNLQSQFLGVVTKPADVQGTASLSWRYRDAEKRDSVWAYVPALRRVRAVSPANRSDGYLGSDFSGDDGFFFDGKPQDFGWKLVGHREGLRFVDPYTVPGLKVEPLPGGGWNTLTDLNPPTAGYRKPGWDGVPWAPTDVALAKRSMWVIEATPHDKYYLYGKIELWIDDEGWDGAWNRKFDYSGELVNSFQSLGRLNQPQGPADDPEWFGASAQVWECAENVKHNRATVGGLRPDPHAPFHRRMRIDPSLFDSAALTRFGK